MNKANFIIGFSFATALSLHAASVSAQDKAPRRLVVVELFTSQGCYSCPPADRYLGRLVKRPGVLALSFHVDYWNYLGWKDPFSAAWATARQKAYRWSLRERMIYTPQIVVDGRTATVGSYANRIDRMIATAAAAVRPRLSMRLERAGTAVRLSIAASETVKRAALFLVRFDRLRQTRIPAGENAGKTLSYHHVVRSLEKIGTFSGAALTRLLPAGKPGAPGGYGMAVIAQRDMQGPVIGAAMLTGPES